MEFQQLFADQFKAVAEKNMVLPRLALPNCQNQFILKLLNWWKKKVFPLEVCAIQNMSLLGLMALRKLILPFLMVINSQELLILREFALNIIKMQIIIMKI